MEDGLMDTTTTTEIDEIATDVEWINRLGVKFPTHGSVKQFRKLLTLIAEASAYDPGETDLDDEQPVTVRGLDLGDVRLARRLLR
jgi:hypothetical protein